MVKRAATIVEAMGCTAPSRTPGVVATTRELASSLDVFVPRRVARKVLATVASRDWQYSTDGGRTWVDVDPFDEPIALRSGTQVTVRCRRRQRVGDSRWSKPSPAVVA